MVATHFSGNAIKIGFFEDFEKPDFWRKMVELLPARFQGHPKIGCYFFLGLFFFFFFLFLLHLARGCAKKPYFYRFFAHPSKASSAIMQQQGSKDKTPQEKGAPFFFRKPLFGPNFLFKNTNFAPPLKTVHKKSPKNLQKTLFL